MQENCPTYKSLLVGRDVELRQEGKITPSFFGTDAETPISALIKELHIHRQDGKTIFSLENPMVGGPVVVCAEGKQTVLIPGEQTTFDTQDLTIFTKKSGHIHIIILEKQEGLTILAE